MSLVPNGPGSWTSGGFFGGIGRHWYEFKPWLCDGNEPHQEQRIVVCRNAVRILFSAPEAAMDNHVLSVSTGQDADRRHQRVAVAFPVAWHAVVDMP